MRADPTRADGASGRRRVPRALALGLGGLLSFVLATVSLSPSWAAPPEPRGGGAAPDEPFSLGAAVSARLDAWSGGLTVDVPIGPLTLRWDSQALATDRSGLGAGWDWLGGARVEVRGGVRVTLASGAVYEADASSPTGLRGRAVADVHFRDDPGILPARDDGLVEARPFRFVLSELGGAVTVFDHAGQPLALMDAFDNRTDWVRDPGSQALTRQVDPVGVVTRFDRSDPDVLRVATAVGARPGLTVDIELDGGRVSAVRGPGTSHTLVGHRRDGRVAAVRTESGAATDVTWRPGPDGRVAVDEIRVTDASSGEAVATRQWQAVSGSASGWPALEGTGPELAEPYRTRLGDGTTDLDSTYGAGGVPVERELRTNSPTGSTLLTRDELTYGGGADHDAGMPQHDSRPTAATTTRFSEAGAERVVAEQYEYDDRGRVIRVRYPDGAIIEHRYDEHGRRTAIIDAAGATSGFVFDRAGRLTEVVQHAADGVELARVGTTYDRHGRVAALTRGNGVTSAFEYTSTGQVSGERTTDASGEPLAERTADYDARGNLLRRVDVVRDPHGADGPAEEVATTTTYRYDVHDRLVGSVVVDGAFDTLPAEASVISRTEYETTVGGDLAQERTETRPGTPEAAELVRWYDYSPTGELERVSTRTAAGPAVAEQRYDDAGNLTIGGDGTRYTYNALNRQITEATTDGRVLTTAYWADGRRASLTDADAHTSTTFYWDGATLVNDVHRGLDGGPSAVSYLLGIARHARTVAGDADTTTYALHDRHGNVAALTTAAGRVTERYAYDDYGGTSVMGSGAGDDAVPFGWRVGDPTVNAFTYAGEYTDPSGTQYLQARSYHPGTRQFTTADTKPLHNRYAYADLNPIMRIDPTGHDSQIDWSRVMLEPWFKILMTSLSIALTVLGFAGMNVPGVNATLMYWAGYLGGVGTATVQAVGTALLAVDTINAVVPEPFWEPQFAGQVQFAGGLLNTVGSIGSVAFKFVRKHAFKAVEESEALLMADNAAKTKQLAALTAERDAIRAALREVAPDHPMLTAGPNATVPLPVTPRTLSGASGTPPAAGAAASADLPGAVAPLRPGVSPPPGTVRDAASLSANATQTGSNAAITSGTGPGISGHGVPVDRY